MPCRGRPGSTYACAVPDPSSPSRVIEIFVREVQETYPPTQSDKLKAHEAAIGRTTHHHDGHRARRCAEWAIALAGDRDLSHHDWQRIKELHAVWRDMTWGAGYALITEGVGPRTPLEDIEIEWVEDAVHVAKIVAEAEGWEHAPWEDLLVELINMEPATS